MRISLATDGLEVGGAGLAAVERRVRFALTRYSPRLRRVAVKLIDTRKLIASSGPRSGRGTVCRVTMTLRNGGELRAVAEAADVEQAAAVAADRAARVLGRAVARNAPSWMPHEARG